jgi:hypothetical protein
MKLQAVKLAVLLLEKTKAIKMNLKKEKKKCYLKIWQPLSTPLNDRNA